MHRTVGVDSIAAYVPRLYIDLTQEWATARAPVLGEGSVDKLVGKVTDGVGVRRMAIADAHQDAATLAGMAAKRVIDAADIDPRDIDYIAVGTETTVDQSKSCAAYVLGMLERHYGVSLRHAGAPQFQFACVGATYALEAAISRIRAGDNTKRYSLVVASDISKYPLATAGEYTQGAGAVALLVSENPRLLALEPGLSATVTRDERDFFRPNWSSLAVVDGKYSIDVYLDCMQEAWVGYAKRAEALLGVPLGKLYDAVQYFLFHVPFPRMAEYAALRIFSTSWLDDAGMRERIATEVPVVSGALDSRASRQQFERALSRTSLFRDAFARKIGPSLSLSRDVGNVYSGSLYLALISLFEQTRSRDLTGSRIALGSYGSGASAKMLSAIVCKEYAPLVDRMRLHEELRPEHEGGTRVALSLSDYERLHGLADTEIDVGEAVASKLRHGSGLSPAEGDALRAALEKPRWRVMPRSASIRAPRGEFALARLGTCATAERTDLGYRYYEWVEP